jgi:hypothetical protein
MTRRNRHFDHTSRRFADKDAPTVKHGLADLVNQRHWFTATFNGIGHTGHGRKVVLLVDVQCDGQPVADHCWIAFTAPIKQLKLGKGGRIRFEARVYRYVKANAAWRQPQHDYSLDDVRCVQRVIIDRMNRMNERTEQ